MQNSIILQNLDTEQLKQLIGESVKQYIEGFQKDISDQNSQDNLLTRTEAYEFLKIDSSTLWNWTKKGKVKAYAIANRRYYKRDELLECLKPVKI